MSNGAGDRSSTVKLLLALAMGLYVAWHSRFWQGTRDAYAHLGADYASLRIQLAFDRTPIAAIARRLDDLLPRDVPVALAPSLVKNDALRQRLIEGLYPRRVDQSAADVLALDRDGFVKTPGADPSTPPRPAEAALESYTFDVSGLLVSVGALLGFGFLLRALVPGLRPEGREELGLPIAVLAGCAVVGALVYAATLAQTGAPWWLYRLAGWTALGYAAWRAKPWRGTGRGGAAAVTPEAWVLVTLVAVLLWRMAVLPVTGWDGRSVWLFHAKQIFFQRMMSLRDLHQADWEWSHPVYPLLVPGVMAMFGGAHRVFNERTAALAVPIVWGASLATFWCLARVGTGRLIGAALAIALFFGTEGLAADLYMDGLVAVLLAVMILALARAEMFGVGILAAFVVSLVKIEGAVAAGLILVGFACFDRRPGRSRLATTAPLALPVVLPLVHRLWLSLHRVTEFQANVGFAKTIEGLPERLPVTLGGLPGLLFRATSGQQVETQAMLRIGLIGLACALGGLVWRARRAGARPLASTASWTALGAGTALVVLAVALVCAMPQEAAWLVTWTLDRLLLHPAVAFAMLAFL